MSAFLFVKPKARIELAARAAELRALGKRPREIGEVMAAEEGRAKPFSHKTVREWLNDPDGSKLKARKDSYRGTCVDCGARTDGSNGRANAPERCHPCRSAYDTIWTRETVIDAIRAFADRYGQQPTSWEWNPSLARLNGRDDFAARFTQDGCWPHTESVRGVFGTWNAAIEAAGFEPYAPGQRGPHRARLEAA